MWNSPFFVEDEDGNQGGTDRNKQSEIPLTHAGATASARAGRKHWEGLISRFAPSRQPLKTNKQLDSLQPHFETEQ